MLKLRSLTPLGAVILTASLLAQQEIPPPPPTPANVPGDASATPKVNVPAAPKPAEEEQTKPSEPSNDATPATTRKPGSSSSKPKGTPMPVATPAPMATPKPGFWKRVFGRRGATPSKGATNPKPADKTTPKPPEKKAPGPTDKNKKATPAPEPTPKATPKPRATPAANTTKTTPKPATTPKVEATPKPAPEVKATPEPKPTPSKKTKKETATTDNVDTEAIERTKVDEAKRKALEDPELVELKAKVDGADNETQAKTALRAYNKAYFQKMRKLDPSIKERLDAMESAVMKRLGE